jgi:phage-related protein
MRAKLASGERLLIWTASSKKDLLAMPRPVVREIGMALGAAQRGSKAPSAKPWKGEGLGVMEIVCDFDSDTFRAVYTVTFKEAIYVLHCFQKKSPRGRKTAKTDVDLIGARLKAAREEHKQRYGKEQKRYGKEEK